MKDNKSIKALKKQMAAAVAMVLVAAVALGSSTYAWFVNNTQVQAENVKVTATTAYSLQIRKNAEGENFGTTANIDGTSPTVLKPVSTVGTESTTAPAFFISKTWDSTGKVADFDNAVGTEYYHSSIQLTAGQASKLYIDSTTTGLSGSTVSTLTPIDVTTFTTANSNLVRAMRVGMLVQDTTGYKGFYVFQLDSTDSSVTGGNQITTKDVGVANADGLNGGVDSTTSTAAFTNTKITNYSSGIPTIASAAVAGSATSLVAGTGGTSLYEFAKAGDICTIDIYVWMEGCDKQCTAADSIDFASFASYMNFGFCVGNPT